MSTTVSTTRAEAVHTALRDEILRGRYQPGHRLRLVELAERFGVSQSVVREALTRLAEQKLADALPQQGFRVITLSTGDLRDLTEARVELESLVIRLAVRRGDVEWEASVVAAHHRLARTGLLDEPDGGVGADWLEVHEAYHRQLLAGCGNRRLTDLATSLRAAATLYRHWTPFAGQDHSRDVADEHRAITDAVVARDADAAARLIGEHIQHTTDVLLEIYAAATRCRT